VAVVASKAASYGGVMNRSAAVLPTVIATLAVALAMRHGTTAEQQSRDGSWQPGPRTPNGPPGTFGAAPSQPPDGAGNPGSRTVEWDGKDLRKRLEASDSRVDVVRSVSPPLMSFPEDPAEELSVHVRRADAIVVLRPTAIVGRLTEAADWVDSTVTADIVDILKQPPKHPLRVGSSIQVNHRGGELTVDGRHIRAVDKGEALPEQGQDYLYFLFDHEGTLHAFPLDMTFGLTDTSVRRLGSGSSTAAFSTRDFLTAVRERVALDRK
jgi:hypothetical protein